MKEKILIFGTGTGTVKIYNLIDLNCFEILAFVDNNTMKHGKEFKGKSIIAPCNINGYIGCQTP